MMARPAQAVLVFLLHVACSQGWKAGTVRSMTATRNEETNGSDPFRRVSNTRSKIEAMIKCMAVENCSSFSPVRTSLMGELFEDSRSGKYTFEADTAAPCPATSKYSCIPKFGTCIVLNEVDKLTWSAAMAACETNGGNLLSLETDQKFAAVKDLIGEKEHTFWLGARHDGDNWLWVTGRRVTTSFWHKDQPENNLITLRVSTGTESFGSFGMDDAEENEAYYSICEY